MPPSPHAWPNAQVLDEDLKIVRATLATIAADVHRLSGEAGQAVEEAIERLDRAQSKFPSLRPKAR